MKIFDWNRYSVGTRVLGLAIGAALVFGSVFGNRVLTELGVPEQQHMRVVVVALLLPALWLLARMKVENEDRSDSER